MSNPVYDEADAKQDVAALQQARGNITEAAKLRGVPRNTFDSRVIRAMDYGLITRAAIREMRRAEEKAGLRLPQTATECWAALDAWIGRAARTVTPPKSAKSKFSDKRIVIASDFHAPFHDVEAVGRMFAATKGYDVLKINGDLQDFYSISRFTKYESVPVEREGAAVDAILSHASGQYAEIDISEGNHDRPRFEKALRTQLSLEQMHVIEYLTGGNLSMVRAIAQRYKNVRFPQVQVGRHHLGWFQQEGDLLMAHAEKFSRVPGAALRGIEEWFSDRHDTLGLAPWRVLIQAHTHQMAWIPWHADRLLIEGGALCQTHGYQLDPKIAGRPQRIGYVTLHQRDGVTDINSIRLHWLDADRKAA